MESENFLTKMGITTHFQDAAKIKIIIFFWANTDSLTGFVAREWVSGLDVKP